MKRNLGVFIIVMLCAVLCIGLGYFNRDSGSSLGWNPNAIYDSPVSDISGGSSFTSATLSGSPSADGSGVVLSMRGGTMSSRARVHHYSYAPASSSMSVSSGVSPISYTSSSKTSSAGSGLYMTSDAEFHSFGGGGNGGAAMGGSMRGASIANNPSPIANSPIFYSPSPIAYSSVNIFSSYTPDEMYNTVATINSYDVANAYSALPTRNGVRGRQNGGVTDSWLDWFYRYGFEHGVDNGDGSYTFSKDQLLAAYNDYITNYWDPMWGEDNKPTYEQWLTWLENAGDAGYGYKDKYFAMLPVGNILPLLLMALLYMVILFVKRNKTAQL